MSDLLRYWYHPSPEQIGDNIADFLQAMDGPCHIEIPGRERNRCRVLVTLLHGNETSGLKALFNLLKDGYQPQVTMHCLLPGTAAAALAPLFTHRQLPGRRDLNRCFGDPFIDDKEGRLCQAVTERINSLQPEAVIDMHNTSGDGPAFAVSTQLLPRHEPLVSLFSERLVVTDLQLGALMELDRDNMPVITIECGGAHQESADQLALEGLQRYFSRHDLQQPPTADWALDIYYHPMRLELHSTITLKYAERRQADANLCLKVDIERHNFGIVTPDTFLGWIDSTGAQALRVRDAGGNDRLAELYSVRNGALYPRCQQKLFMITSNATIARSDCLWYTVID